MNVDEEPLDVSSVRRLNRRRCVAVVGFVVALSVTAGALVRNSSEPTHRVAIAGVSASTLTISSDATSTAVPISGTSTTPPSALPGSAVQDERCENCTTYGPVSTAPDDLLEPHPADFTGTLTASLSPEDDGSPWNATVLAGQDVWLTLHIRNVTDHVIAPSTAGHKNLQVVCAADMTAEGHTGAELRVDLNFFFVTNASIGPGEVGGAGPMTLPMTSADIGTMTCAAVIVAPPPNGRPIARLTSVDLLSFAVIAEQPTTTGPSSTNTLRT